MDGTAMPSNFAMVCSRNARASPLIDDAQSELLHQPADTQVRLIYLWAVPQLPLGGAAAIYSSRRQR